MIDKVPDHNTSVIKGGGEMGSFIRSKDWSNSTLGCFEKWPQSLITTVNIILNSKYPMFLWWGPDLICFYNDAYRPSLGSTGKHPSILGIPAKEAWNEIWETIQPLIKEVLKTGEATWSEDQLIPIFRNGEMEDIYWTYSYSAVYNEAGNINGILVTCSETTDKVKILNEVKQSEATLKFTIEAAGLATWDLNPLTNKFSGNTRLKELFGLEPKLEIDLATALSRIVDADRDRVLSAITDALKIGSDGNYDLIYSIFNPITKTEKKVLAKGKALLNDDGITYKFSGILQDITQQDIFLKQLEENEKKFKNVVKQAPLGIIIFKGPEYIVEMANESYLQIIDRGEADIIGKPFFDSVPEVKETIDELLKNVLKTGIPYYGTEFAITLNRYGKEELSYFNFVYHPLREENDEISGIIVVATEVTEAVLAKQALAESEKQFRNLVMQSPIPMTIFRGKDFIIEVANTAILETIWRKKPKDVFGKKALEVFPELKDQKYAELLNKVFITGLKHAEIESIAYVHGDDGLKKFYFDFEYSPLFETDGSVSGIIVTVNNVTEKVESRKKVEESERRFRTVANGAPVLIWMAGTDKLCNFFNKAWLSFTGRTLEQEFGNGWAEGVHPEDFKRCVDIYANSFDARKEFYMEYRLKRHDGEYRWISDSGVPRIDVDGTFEGFIGACMDIHDTVMHQQTLIENEARLNVVIDATELGTWELNILNNELNYSDRYLQVFGYSPGSKLTHEEIISHLHPKDLPIRQKAFLDAFETGTLHYTSRVIWADNSIHWMEGRGKVFYNEEKKPIKMIGTVRDVTVEKNYQQTLEDREQKFRLLADSMPQHIWTADINGNLNYFNQSLYDYSGLSAEQIELEGWIQIVHPEDRDENIREWSKAINTGTDFLIENRFRRHDGLYRWQLSRAIPQKDASGNIQMWVGTSTDIEDQKTFTNELEKQIQERTRELEQKNNDLEKMNVELQSFAYVSSHDLQEPLRKIQTFSSRILQKESHNLSESGQDYFKRMQEAAKRMQTLIEDLLAYSRTNTTERVFIKTSLKEIVEDVKTDLKELILENHVIIETGRLCEIEIIPFQFRQLMHNLIGNSIKFARTESPPHIKIQSKVVEVNEINIDSVGSYKRYCHLSVSDNGIGFEPEYKHRIFEVFQRLHAKSEFKGTGIGLAIVKKIIENHNGIIDAHGEPGKGATFNMYVPID